MSKYNSNGHEIVGRREVIRHGVVFVLGALILNACGTKRSTVSPPSPMPTKSTPEQATATPEVARYPEHTVIASVFWIGEGASDANAGISNTSTEWETNPIRYLGGVDDPTHRQTDGQPAGFDPKENPYYVALPASEFDNNGIIPGSREASPWSAEAGTLSPNQSLFKGRWVRISRAGMDPVYAQWVDTGPSDDPSATHDYGYVFGNGNQQPANQFGLKAGIDVSPSTAFVLDFNNNGQGSAEVTWNFVDPQDVPHGLWSDYPPITNETHWE